MFRHKRIVHAHSPLDHLKATSMKRVAFEVALLEKKRVAEGTVAFIFEKPNGFPLRAGQHIRMTLLHPTETDSFGKSRFFSLANSPLEAHLVLAMRMRDTAFKRVLGRMSPGEKVLIETLLNSPHQPFALHDASSKPAVFLIGGIGIVPAFSMMKDTLERKLPHRMFLFYSNRRPEDAPFLDELEQLAKQHPSFTLIATMTQPEKSASSWRGETGYIDDSMIKRYVDDQESAMYYIAGLPEMVGAMKTMLTERGVSQDNIRTEEFAGFIMGQHESMGQHDVPHSKNKRMRLLLLGAIGLMIIGAVFLHATPALALFQTGWSAFTLLTTGLLLIMILLKIFALFKGRHFLGLKHSKQKESAWEMLKEK